MKERCLLKDSENYFTLQQNLKTALIKIRIISIRPILFWKQILLYGVQNCDRNGACKQIGIG
jgi:hypothetical protein